MLQADRQIIISKDAETYHCSFYFSRDGSRRDNERSETHAKKQQSSTESSGHSSQQQSTSIPSSPHSTRLSPRFSPHHSPRARTSSPPSSSSTASQPPSITTSQSASSLKVSLLPSVDEGASVAKHHPLQIVSPMSSHSTPSYGPAIKDKLKDGKGRPSTTSSISPGGTLQRKVHYT